MEYQERTVQRVFSVRFSKGDRIIQGLEKLVEEKNIRTGMVIFIGAFLKGNLVLGFKEYSRAPMDFDRTSFEGIREVMGMGSITWVNDKPKVHLHAALAKEREVFLAHIEEADLSGSEVFIVELSGTGFVTSALV